MFNYSKVLIGITALAATILPAVTFSSPAQANARNGAPNYMIRTYKDPKVYAVFTDRKESFWVGCPNLLRMWSQVRVQQVTSDIFKTLLANNPPVADLPCNGTIEAYKPWYQKHIYLLIKHKNGVKHRHYVNDFGFLRALGSGDVIPVDPDSFRKFPRGTDFIKAKH